MHYTYIYTRFHMHLCLSNLFWEILASYHIQMTGDMRFNIYLRS